MEIGEINRLAKIRPQKQSERTAAATKVEDKVRLSIEAQKRMAWVEMLKAMPEISQDQIVAQGVYRELTSS